MGKKVKKNKYDVTGENLKRGKKAENLFKEILKKNGFNPIPSAKQEDINEHWDFKIEKDGKEYKIDVKSMKKIGRKDKEVQDKWHWIELHGVRENDKGWLYGGKADFIAFETKESFLIVRRKDLIRLVENLVDTEKVVESPYEAKYKIYRRKNRPDKITLIETRYIRKISIKEYKKLED